MSLSDGCIILVLVLQFDLNEAREEVLLCIVYSVFCVCFMKLKLGKETRI